MTLLTLALTLALQTPYGAAARSQPYAPPVVRPFEPDADFGLGLTNADGTMRAVVLDRPVDLDAYHDDYEPASRDLDAAFQQGVAVAEARADALSGPLDGRWTITGADGHVLGRLVVNDPGGDRAIEGAWQPQGEVQARPLSTITRDGERITVDLGGRDGALRLRPGSGGWTGTLANRSVSLRRGF